MADGWLIGVLVEVAGEPAPLRHYFAVGHEDQAKCEWTAVDYGRPRRDAWPRARVGARSRWRRSAR